MLRMFGLGEGPAEDSQGRKVIGWGQKVEGGDANVSMEVRHIYLTASAPMAEVRCRCPSERTLSFHTSASFRISGILFGIRL